MKKISYLLTLTIICILFFTTNSFAQDFKKLDVSPMDAAAYPSSHNEFYKLVKVTYSRPQLRGRTIESLTPNGKVWRTGANEASEITFFSHVLFGDKKVKAGTYSLFTIPGEKEWTIILNYDTDMWGAYSYDEANDVARVKVPVTEGKESLEAFSIAFDENATMYLAWDTLRIAVPIKKQ
ncbi:hypothetical protein GCM10022271_12640 [Corallibacter vietnamensis]|uniref:DUF2911 domain-containing protein n=1 Tax=Corallibacter vietnamensis TaxID=904130 RepID=A0ABP7H454_9FLAO